MYEISKIVACQGIEKREERELEKIRFQGPLVSWNTSSNRAFIKAEWFHILFTPITFLSSTSITNDLWFFKVSVRFLHRAVAHIQSIYEHVSKRRRERISEHLWKERKWGRGERSPCLVNNRMMASDFHLCLARVWQWCYFMACSSTSQWAHDSLVFPLGTNLAQRTQW